MQYVPGTFTHPTSPVLGLGFAFATRPLFGGSTRTPCPMRALHQVRVVGGGEVGCEDRSAHYSLHLPFRMRARASDRA